MIKKAASQPPCLAIQGTVNGASMAPTLAPELNIPVANDLSFFGKYSAVALIAAGKLPDSPKPSTALWQHETCNRYRHSSNTDPAKDGGNAFA